MDGSGSCEALQVKEKRQEEEELKEEEDGDEGEVEAEEEVSQLGEFQEQAGLPSPQPEVELREAKLESQEAASSSGSVLSDKDQCSGLQEGLEMKIQMGDAIKEQVGLLHEEVPGSVIERSAEIQSQDQHQSSEYPTPMSTLSPTSVTQSSLSAPSPTLLEPKASLPRVKNACMAVADQQNSSDLKILTVVPIVKARVPDGYNWRKYGQKQVKSPKGSRSYYKCTYADCYAKKIESADHSGHVIEVVNKGTHSHDPPRKNNCTSESKATLFSRPALGKSVTDHPVRMLKDPSLATMSMETLKETPLIPERKRENSVVSDGNGETQIKDENAGEPEPKRRMKKENLACPKTLLKPGKKPKFVVHAAGDVGISGDGYRWRKYGQKMVKGNPHPRNYYRCTSAGCPVRKHIETAVDNPTALIITYKGVHDHDTPVPKKRHGPPSAPLVAAAAPASMSSLQLKKTNTLQSHVTSTQWSVGKEGELNSETLDVGADKEKTIESARTLLSIGFEIKPC